MTKRVIEHEIKLEKSVKIILGVLAFGVFLNAFAPVFDVRKAFAELTDSFGTYSSPFVVRFELGGKTDTFGNRSPVEFECINCK